jgi:mRNA interferase RelE/StbE
MKWKLIFEKKAEKEFFKLDSFARKMITKAIDEKLLINPNQHLIPLSANLSGYYKFRVGNYRLICEKEDENITILVVKVKHRKEVYKE